MRESSVAAPMRNNKGESIGNERFPANQVAKSGFPARGRPEGEGLTAQPAGASAGGGFSTHRLVRFSPLPARPRGRDRPSLLSRSQIPRLFPAGGSGLRSRVPPPPPPLSPDWKLTRIGQFHLPRERGRLRAAPTAGRLFSLGLFPREGLNKLIPPAPPLADTNTHFCLHLGTGVISRCCPEGKGAGFCWVGGGF